MEKNNITTKYPRSLIVVIFFIILLGIILLIANVSTITHSNQKSPETILVEQGKVKSHENVINEIAEIFKNREKEKLDTYLSKNFLYYDNSNFEHKYISSFWDDIDYLVSDYDIEKRGNSIDNKETYLLYWNINSSIKEPSSNLYCLQKIYVYLQKVVKEDIVTYEIEKISLKS